MILCKACISKYTPFELEISFGKIHSGNKNWYNHNGNNYILFALEPLRTQSRDEWIEEDRYFIDAVSQLLF